MKPSFDVLLVEDERVVMDAAARILGPEGVSVDRAGDVAEALQRLRAAEHRVILSDLMLPGFSGFDLLARVASDRRELPVILITGYATIENALRAFKRGAFDFLPKPFDVPELLGVVRRALACTEKRCWNPHGPARDLLAADRKASREGLWFLGQHAWARVRGEEATFGVAESWPGLVAPIVELRLPEVGTRVTQGLACVELATADESIHRIWAPLGGTVVATNPELGNDPDLLNRAPFSSGWLCRIAAADLAGELDALTLRSGAATTAARGGGEKEKSWSS